VRIATISAGDGSPRVALAVGSAVVDLHAGARELGHDKAADLPEDLLGIVEAGPEAWEAAENLDEALSRETLADAGKGSWWWAAEDVKFEVPLRPRKNPWVVGSNYFRHLANGFERIPRPASVPALPEFFSKAYSSISGDGDPMVFDRRATATVDYETELCMVLGREGKDIPRIEGHDYIFGYTVCNDTSAREIQVGHQQFFRGKSLEGFCPLGPVIVTPRHIPNPYALTIRTRINGEPRQNWPVGDMLFKLDELVSSLSQGMTIEPGDMVICGTVPGVGFEQLPQTWLLHGDIVESEITQIGTLRNEVQQMGVGA
jgi:2-keto-4-pentenoate hydratase/2-oxohepta-3-ene-1,7-dioic acid hydratase in catechol pathway